MSLICPISCQLLIPYHRRGTELETLYVVYSFNKAAIIVPILCKEYKAKRS